MISQHRKFIRTKQTILSEKEEALEACRLEYLAKCQKIMTDYHAQIRAHSVTQFNPEIIHGLK